MIDTNEEITTQEEELEVVEVPELGLTTDDKLETLNEDILVKNLHIMKKYDRRLADIERRRQLRVKEIMDDLLEAEASFANEKRGVERVLNWLTTSIEPYCRQEIEKEEKKKSINYGDITVGLRAQQMRIEYDTPTTENPDERKKEEQQIEQQVVTWSEAHEVPIIKKPSKTALLDYAKRTGDYTGDRWQVIIPLEDKFYVKLGKEKKG